MHTPSPSQEVPEMCFGGKAYYYRVLPFAISEQPSCRGRHPAPLRGWMLWCNRGWGFVCTPSPDRSAPGSSRESAHGWGPSIEKPCSGRAEYSSLTRFLSSTALHGGFPSGGIFSHWQRAWSFTPARSCGNCGCGSRGGTTHSLWSLNWGCWDHPPI